MVQFLAPCRLPTASTSGLEPSILAVSRFFMPCHELEIFVATNSLFRGHKIRVRGHAFSF